MLLFVKTQDDVNINVVKSHVTVLDQIGDWDSTFKLYNAKDIQNLPDKMLKILASEQFSWLAKSFVNGSDRIPKSLVKSWEKMIDHFGSGQKLVDAIKNKAVMNRVDLWRDFLTDFYKELELKGKGELPKRIWKDYRSSIAGWTDDLIDKSILDDYKDYLY